MIYQFSCLHVSDYVLCQATINIIFDRVGRVDPVTRGIEIAVNYLGIQFDVSSFSVEFITESTLLCKSWSAEYPEFVFLEYSAKRWLVNWQPRLCLAKGSRIIDFQL